MKTNITVQVNGSDTLISVVEKAAKEALKATGTKMTTVEELNVYLKPVENECYFAASTKDGKKVNGKVEL